MPDRVLAEIEADIAEAERLISELRLEIAAKKSAGEDTSRSEQRVWKCLRVGCCWRISGRRLWSVI
jgi:hypothetical protein